MREGGMDPEGRTKIKKSKSRRRRRNQKLLELERRSSTGVSVVIGDWGNTGRWDNERTGVM